MLLAVLGFQRLCLHEHLHVLHLVRQHILFGVQATLSVVIRTVESSAAWQDTAVVVRRWRKCRLTEIVMHRAQRIVIDEPPVTKFVGDGFVQCLTLLAA